MKILLTQPKQFVSPVGTIVSHIFKVHGTILCDFEGIAILLECDTETAIQLAKQHDCVSLFDRQLYCTADDFAFIVDKLPNVPLSAKQLGKWIEKSETEMMHHFLFKQSYVGK